MRKEFAKQLCKLLKNNNIKAGNIKGNGTTEPDNPRGYDVHFTWENHDKEEGYKYLYLNFKAELGQEIKKVLDRAEIPYWWNGESHTCFKLIPMKIEFCQKCKKTTPKEYYHICKECSNQLHLQKKLWKDYDNCTTKDKKGACDDPECPTHGYLLKGEKQ